MPFADLGMALGLTPDEDACLNSGSNCDLKNDIYSFLNVNILPDGSNWEQDALDFAGLVVDELVDNCEWDFEVDFENKFIKDPSFTGTDAECVLDELVSTENNIFKTVSEAFTNQDSQYKIRFTVEQSPTNSPAHTSLPEDTGIINIKVDPDYVNGNAIDLAGIILHEVIHAELHRIYLNNNQGPNPMPQEQFNWYVKLWEFYYNGVQSSTASTAEHNYMALYYIDNIAQGVREFDENAQTLEHYKAFAWTGLQFYGRNAGYITTVQLNNYTNLANVVYTDNHINNCDN